MIPIDRCRQILGPVARDMTDMEVEGLRRQLYSLANITVSVFLEQEPTVGDPLGSVAGAGHASPFADSPARRSPPDSEILRAPGRR